MDRKEQPDDEALWEAEQVLKVAVAEQRHIATRRNPKKVRQVADWLKALQKKD